MSSWCASYSVHVTCCSSGFTEFFDFFGKHKAMTVTIIAAENNDAMTAMTIVIVAVFAKNENINNKCKLIPSEHLKFKYGHALSNLICNYDFNLKLF